MEKVEWQDRDISDAIIHDGFEYALEDYSDWTEIEDEKFHALRREYLSAKKELLKYIEKKQKEWGRAG